VLTHFPTLETINFPDSRLNGSLVQGTHFPGSVKNLYVQGSVITELGLSAAGMTVDASNIKTLKKINVEKGANITSIRLTLSKAESLVIRGTVMVLYSENLGLNTLDIANGVTLGEVWLNGGNVTKVNWNFNFEDLHLSNNQITDATLVQGYSYGHLDLSNNKATKVSLPVPMKSCNFANNMLAPYLLKFTQYNSDFSNNNFTSVETSTTEWSKVVSCDFSGNPLKCPIAKELYTYCFATCK